MPAIKAMLAFSNLLFSEGVARLLEDDKGFNVCMLKDRKEPLKAIDAERPDVILLDIITLYNNLSDIKSNQQIKLILVDTGCGEENIKSAFVNRKLSGVLMSDANSCLLKKAIMVVANGEIWVDKNTIKNLLSGVNPLKKGNRVKLSEREQEIVHLVSLGFRNKEVAQKLNISEPTVKSHLHAIFQKLNVLNRYQLMALNLEKQNLQGINTARKQGQ